MTFKKAILTYGAADLLSKAVGLITSPITTRLLTLSQYGTGPLLSSVWSVFALAQYGGSDSSYPYFLAQKTSEREERKLIVTASILAYISVFCVWVIFCVFAFSTRWLVEYAGTKYGELVFFSIGLLPTGLIYWFCYILRFLHRPESYVRITLLGRVLPLVFVLPFLPLFEQDDRLVVSFAGSFFVSLIALAYAFYEVRRVGVRPFNLSLFDPSLSRKLLRYGLLLVPAGAAYALIVTVDRLLLGFFLGTDAVAIYAIAVSIGGLGTMLVGWFGLAFDPYLITWVAKDSVELYLPRIQLMVSTIASFFGCLTCLAAIWSTPIISLLYPVAYHEAAVMVPFLFLSASFAALSRIGVSTSVIAQTPKYQTILYFTALVANFLLGWILIKNIGILGAVLSTIFSELVILLGWIYLGRLRLRNLAIRWAHPMMIYFLTTLFIFFVMSKSDSFSILERCSYSLLIVAISCFIYYWGVGANGMNILRNYLMM